MSQETQKHHKGSEEGDIKFSIAFLLYKMNVLSFQFYHK